MKFIDKISVLTRVQLIACLVVVLQGCDSFTDTDLPPTQLNTDIVFESPNTATAALTDIYARMRESGFVSGNGTGIGYLMSMYTDELAYLGSTSTETAFYTNSVLSATAEIKGIWNNSYSRIYAANAVIEGVAGSMALGDGDRRQLTGEALFIRAMEHLYLNQLWGEVPYITTTDYRINSIASRTPQEEIYGHLVNDLQQAVTLLNPDYITSERIRPNTAAAHALLARVYLYAGRWAEAADQASAVINNTGLYDIQMGLGEEFLKESRGAIWQLKPLSEGQNADEGSSYIFTSTPPLVSISPQLLGIFEPGDQRRDIWINAVSGEQGTFYHAHKYRQYLNTGTSLEYSQVLRLAEQYLIRAEARARQGELVGALEDLNVIRQKAGLGISSATTQADVLLAILRERNAELFTEHAHRFIDLKRFGMLDSTLAPAKPGWDTNDRLLPIPEAELGLNPNLLPQNTGY